MPRAAHRYLIVVGLCLLGATFILYLGNQRLAPQLSPGANVERSPIVAQAGQTSLEVSVAQRLLENAADPLGRFFLQLVVILVVSNRIGRLFTRCGQPAVVGEMMAGILLGPSLFGFLAPNIFHFVFAASSLEPLRLLSQVGVCLFMFAVGLESDWTELRSKASTAILIGHAGIALPSLLGVGLAFFLYDSLAQPGAHFIDFALFVAISISITAFPVLVRILQDRRILTTALGQMAAASAAVGDATAWAFLALIVALPKSADFRSAGVCLSLAILFVVIMFGLVRPRLPKLLGEKALEHSKLPKGTLAIVVCFVLIAALTTQLLGIHALFGAFLAGLVMPNVGSFREKLVIRVENLSSVFLLPVFFAFSGLRTQVGLLQSGTDWAICLLIIAVAIAGKLGGTVTTARMEGMSWRESLQLGALMNTRGLMELIALNLGYELHILSQRLFSMLVIMALVTTIMTGPLLSLFQQKRAAA